jgi:hypothetical protein
MIFPMCGFNQTLISSGRLSMLGHNQCMQHWFCLLRRQWTTNAGMLGIIVRDDAARESFKTEIGRVGVTLYVRSSLCYFRYLDESPPGHYSIAKVLNTMM